MTAEVFAVRDLEPAVLEFAKDLGAWGIGPGAIVGLLGENSVAWIAAHLALARLGAASLPLNFRLADPELAWQLEHAGARALLTDRPGRLPGPVEAWPLQAPRSVGASPAATSLAASIPSRAEPDRPHTVLFTSGTTGKPKGVVLTWRQHRASARAMAEALELTADDRWLLCMPLFHVGGLAIVHRMALAGGTIALLSRFDLEAVHQAILSHRPTRISLTTTMARRLLDAHPRALDGLDTVLLGGEAIGADILARCPNARPSYGLTEAGSTVAMAAPGQAGLRLLPGFDVRLSADDGAACDAGEVGRIAIRGPAMMQGYLGQEPLAGGWFETGDLGMLAIEGSLTVLARRDDLILSGGENVYPAEIEAALLDHPDVLGAAVTGVPDDRWGQVPVAAVVCRSADLDPSALAGFVRSKLASYKVPKRIAFVETLPSRPSGKLDRRAIAGLFAPSAWEGS